MSTFTTSGDGRKEAVKGQPLSCPKCHAPLAAPKARAARSGGRTPVWLRLLILVLLLAALAAPIGGVYYLRSRVLDNASSAARNYLDSLRTKDAKAAKELMREEVRSRPNTISLQKLMALDNAGYQVTEAKRNGALVDVAVTCILPDDAKLPTLPLAMDKNPRITLVLDQEESGQWRVVTVSLLPKEGSQALPDYGKMKKAIPGMGK
jgi:hypothetical protein